MIFRTPKLPLCTTVRSLMLRFISAGPYHIRPSREVLSTKAPPKPHAKEKAGSTIRSRLRVQNYRTMLVASVAISVTVDETFTEILLVQRSITEARIVVGAGALKSTLIAIL